jgi:UDPglucose--hexose-1-phosphate uridylyltransferase
MTIRQNYLTNETIYIAEDRALRPIETGTAVDRRIDRNLYNDQCPFCPGNEHIAAEEIYRTENNRVRIIWNKYPFVEMPAGQHYVLIDTPNHQEKIYNFETGHIADIYHAASLCFCREYANGAAYLQLFKNDGARAGASLHHSHWQITALATTPPVYKTITSSFRKYTAHYNSCFICDELKKENYIVYENEHFTAFCPYAPRYSNEINIAPKSHIQSLTQLDDTSVICLADALKKCLNALNTIIPYFSFNIYLHESRPAAAVDSHFFLVIAPRTGSLAGFELAAGIFVHADLPEISAVNIRKVCRG